VKVTLIVKYAKKGQKLMEINLVANFALLELIHLQDQKNALNVFQEHIHLQAGLPAQYVENLTSEKYSDNKGYYEVAGYSGYEVVVEETVAETGEGENRTRTVLDSDEHVEFDVEIGLKGRESAYKPDTSEPADAETAETADDAEE
jgi:hypothetical protein